MKKIGTVTKIEETEQGLYFTVKPDHNAVNAYQKPTKRPPARKPRNRRVSSFSMPVEHQGGRVRAWFAKNAGLLCIAVGWIFAFALIAIPKTHENAAFIIELAVFGSAFFGFGLGWIVQDERHKRC